MKRGFDRTLKQRVDINSTFSEPKFGHSIHYGGNRINSKSLGLGARDTTIAFCNFQFWRGWSGEVNNGHTLGE